MVKHNNGGLVYSTSFGRMCPGCNQPADQCTCQQTQVVSQGDGIVRVSRETKGRKGKGVTLVKGLALDNKRLSRLAKKLKQRCGAGGAVKDGVIEIQGDHRDQLVLQLQDLGYTVKRAGG